MSEKKSPVEMLEDDINRQRRRIADLLKDCGHSRRAKQLRDCGNRVFAHLQEALDDPERPADERAMIFLLGTTTGGLHVITELLLVELNERRELNARPGKQNTAH